jgi:tetratricopeptide (TPR) repeat protein
MRFSSKLVSYLVAAACVPGWAQTAGDPLAAARAMAQAGELDHSASALHAYLESNPTSADAHFLLGYVEFRQQKPRESLAEFTAGARYRRPNADELLTVASDYVLLGDYVDADKWFSDVTRETPQNADAWYLLGRTKYNESDYHPAIACFERALALRPKYIEAENNLGLAWRDLNDMEKARAAFQTAIDWQGSRPLDPQPFLNLGMLLADQSDFKGALVPLERARDLSPANPSVHENLARVYEATNQLGQAESELKQAIALAPKASALHFKLARVYRREGLEQQAKSEFELCEKLNGTQSSTDTPNPPSHPSSPRE